MEPGGFGFWVSLSHWSRRVVGLLAGIVYNLVYHFLTLLVTLRCRHCQTAPPSFIVRSRLLGSSQEIHNASEHVIPIPRPSLIGKLSNRVHPCIQPFGFQLQALNPEPPYSILHFETYKLEKDLPLSFSGHGASSTLASKVLPDAKLTWTCYKAGNGPCSSSRTGTTSY